MSDYRIKRINEDIKRELSAIFRELKDPRIENSFTSIVKVDTTKDLSYCNIYISSIGGLKKAEQVCHGLKSASGYIKRELARKLEIRHIPDLIFHASDSIEYSANISKILNDLNGD